MRLKAVPPDVVPGAPNGWVQSSRSGGTDCGFSPGPPSPGPPPMGSGALLRAPPGHSNQPPDRSSCLGLQHTLSRLARWSSCLPL